MTDRKRDREIRDNKLITKADSQWRVLVPLRIREELNIIPGVSFEWVLDEESGCILLVPYYDINIKVRQNKLKPLPKYKYRSIIKRSLSKVLEDEIKLELNHLPERRKGVPE